MLRSCFMFSHCRYRNNALNDDGLPHPTHTFASSFKTQTATHTRPQQWSLHTNCSIGTTFETTAPTMTTDRVCSPVAAPCNSAANLFEVSAPTYTTDRQVRNLGGFRERYWHTLTSPFGPVYGVWRRQFHNYRVKSSMYSLHRLRRR